MTQDPPADAGGGERDRGRWRTAALILGPVLFLLLYLGPSWGGLDQEPQAVLALTAWVALWWMTEAVPLGATSLVPLIALPLLGVLDLPRAASAYAEPTIFLFMGGFFLAAAFQKWDLHRRLATAVLGRVGRSPKRVLAAAMGVTAFLSMWVSNTATAVMMLPIGVALAAGMTRGIDPTPQAAGGWRYGLSTTLMLGIAYAASIGGMATLVGTPPNLLFAGQAPTLAPGTGEVSFARWMLLGLPLSVAYLSLAWAYLAFLVLRPSPTPSDPPAPSRPAPQAPMTWPQRAVTFVFLATVFAWVFKTDLDLGAFTLPGWATWLGLEVHDATIALTAALILFVLPSGRGRRDFVLDWRTAASIPWEVLILFGGGFALAQGFVASGLAERLGALLSALDVLPLPLVILALCVVVVVGSEIASNTALTAIILPVAAATAQGMGLHPYWLMVPATLAASTGFMLPVATPPNAVAFASGYVTAPQMAKAGVVLDLLGILLVTAASLTLLPWAFSLT